MASNPPPKGRHRPRNILLTGGAGFIGSHLADALLRSPGLVGRLVIIDRLSTGGRTAHLQQCLKDARAHLVVDDLIAAPLAQLLAEAAIDTVIHAAAESHVDRSIARPADFILSNIVGTERLLEACRTHGESRDTKDAFRLIHLSTDEVYGPAGRNEGRTPKHPMRPSSPYAASKAAAELLVRAWERTYGLPAIVTHCTNNYGPRQWPEKLIPRALDCALRGAAIPLYGDGTHERTWLAVADHVAGLVAVVKEGIPGQSYAFSGDTRLGNRDLLEQLGTILDAQTGRPAGSSRKLIQQVDDRPGHDRGYALDDQDTRLALGWAPQVPFGIGLEQTVAWYLNTPIDQGGLRP